MCNFTCCSQHLVVVVSEKLALLFVEFKREMSKTWLWRFKFGISGFYSNVNEGWNESSVVHRIPTD